MQAPLSRHLMPSAHIQVDRLRAVAMLQQRVLQILEWRNVRACINHLQSSNVLKQDSGRKSLSNVSKHLLKHLRVAMLLPRPEDSQTQSKSTPTEYLKNNYLNENRKRELCRRFVTMMFSSAWCSSGSRV
eukprot:6492268-Amphidinium_carterae.1